MFLVPIIACVALLAAAWWADALPHRLGTSAFVLVGVTVQILAPVLSVLWVLALLLNVATAIYLIIRLGLSN